MDSTGTTAPVVPGWQVLRELGRGGAAAVWLVVDAEGRQAALKVPDRRADVPAELLDIEVRAVGELAHAHVVRPLGVVETDRGPGLLSEYHPGGSLGALVRAAGPLPVGQVVTVLVPVAQALQALHDHGVVHGDLSPGNVLFTVQGRPAVADLGSSRLLGVPSAHGGTQGFTAPELECPGAGGRGDAPSAPGPSPAADVYSLAAVGWYALTGRAPARTSSRAPLPLIVPDVPAEVVTLLEAGLDEDPDARPRADRFALACYRWAGPEPVDLHPSASPEVARELPTRRRPDPPVRKRHRPALLASGAGLVIALGVGGAAVAGGALDPASTADPTAASSPVPSAGSSAGGTEAPSPDEPAGRSSAPAATMPAPRQATPAGLGSRDASAAAVALGPARAEALTSLDHRDVAVYSLPDSPAHRGDVRLMSELRDRDLRYRGLELETTVAGPVERPAVDEARVPLVLTIGPYRTVTTAGEPVAESTAPSTERLTVEMTRTAGGWRVHRVIPVTGVEEDTDDGGDDSGAGGGAGGEDVRVDREVEDTEDGGDRVDRPEPHAADTP